MEVQGRLHFLGIPPELRLAIYHLYLEEHRRVHENRQPTNAHLRLLLISHQVCEEAQSILRQYISLKNERQIELFLWNVGDKRASCLTFADVANDGRVELSELSVKTPISGLHLALQKMTHLQHLRVFEYEATPYLSLYQTVSRTRWSWQFEAAMYPAACPLRLLSYELYLSPEVRVQALEQIRSHHLRTLRLSGNCQLLREHDTSSLRNLIITGVTGSYFDQRRLDQCFLDAPLESFMYGMGHRLGFEIRNHHLQSLVSGPRPQHLRKLVLVGCSRLTSEAITQCLAQLHVLEYLALSLVTVDEIRTNFVAALPPTVSTLKLTVINAWFSIPLIKEERILCDTLETSVLVRRPSLTELRLHFRPSLLEEGGRGARWRRIADNARVNLSLGPWEQSEVF